MAAWEVKYWSEYSQRRGSLNIGRRVEAGAALIATSVVTMGGGKIDMNDLQPHNVDPIDPEEQMRRAFGG